MHEDHVVKAELHNSTIYLTGGPTENYAVYVWKERKPYKCISVFDKEQGFEEFFYWIRHEAEASSTPI